MKKFYITTPIYYVNDRPHIGHAYTTIIADTLARYFRLRGVPTLFVTGTDENSQKNIEAAAKAGEPNIQKYLDDMSTLWQKTFAQLGISNDDFIRTTEERHKVGVAKFWKKVWDNGDIYQGTYEGWYCERCEAFVTEYDLVDGNCPIHKAPPKRLKEKNYFFRLTKYRDALLQHIEDHPDFALPESRRNEIKNYIKDFMQDISISRESITWGIPVPNDPSQVIYVWFDALLNYITAIGYGTDEKNFARWWPADAHLVGKDIIKFHCALWPAMLLAAGLPLPKKVFAHGFFTVNGDKMSKSLGNFIDPLKLLDEYGSSDPLRFYCLRDLVFGEDGDFSTVRLRERYESELANELGNLVHRVLAMTEQSLGGATPLSAEVPQLRESCKTTWRTYEEALEALRFHDAVAAVWSVIRSANRLIDDEKPWELAKRDPARLAMVLAALLETIRQLAWMLTPLLPETSGKIFASLGITRTGSYEKAKQWGGLAAGIKIKKGAPLFPKKEIDSSTLNTKH